MTPILFGGLPKSPTPNTPGPWPSPPAVSFGAIRCDVDVDLGHLAVFSIRRAARATPPGRGAARAFEGG